MKKLLCIAVMTIFALSTCVLNVYAASNCEIKITPSSEIIKAGDEVTLTFSTRNFSGITSNNGLAGIEATLNYDNTIFEDVKAENFEGVNGWSLNNYNSQNKKFILTSSTIVSQEGDVFKLKLKVRSNITVTDTTIKLSSGVVGFSDKITKINLADTSFILKSAISSVQNQITTPTPTLASTSTNSGNSITINNSLNNSSNGNKTATGTPTQNTSNIKSSTSSSSSNLPKTGAETVVIPSIVIIALIGIIAYFQYRKMKY